VASRVAESRRAVSEAVPALSGPRGVAEAPAGPPAASGPTASPGTLTGDDPGSPGRGAACGSRAGRSDGAVDAADDADPGRTAVDVAGDADPGRSGCTVDTADAGPRSGGAVATADDAGAAASASGVAGAHGPAPGGLAGSELLRSVKPWAGCSPMGTGSAGRAGAAVGVGAPADGSSAPNGVRVAGGSAFEAPAPLASSLPSGGLPPVSVGGSDPFGTAVPGAGTGTVDGAR
jgi:hypothetical protein